MRLRILIAPLIVVALIAAGCGGDDDDDDDSGASDDTEQGDDDGGAEQLENTGSVVLLSAVEPEEGDAVQAIFDEDINADADYTAFDGTRMSGRRAIADGHRALFAGIMRNSRMVSESRDVRFPAPDVAVACERGGIDMAWQKRRTVPTARAGLSGPPLASAAASDST